MIEAVTFSEADPETAPSGDVADRSDRRRPVLRSRATLNPPGAGDGSRLGQAGTALPLSCAGSCGSPNRRGRSPTLTCRRNIRRGVPRRSPEAVRTPAATIVATAFTEATPVPGKPTGSGNRRIPGGARGALGPSARGDARCFCDGYNALTSPDTGDRGGLGQRRGTLRPPRAGDRAVSETAADPEVVKTPAAVMLAAQVELEAP